MLALGAPVFAACGTATVCVRCESVGLWPVGWTLRVWRARTVGRAAEVTRSLWCALWDRALGVELVTRARVGLSWDAADVRPADCCERCSFGAYSYVLCLM